MENNIDKKLETIAEVIVNKIKEQDLTLNEAVKLAKEYQDKYLRAIEERNAATKEIIDLYAEKLVLLNQLQEAYNEISSILDSSSKAMDAASLAIKQRDELLNGWKIRSQN